MKTVSKKADQVSYEAMTITPETAKKWLDANSFDNRRLDDYRVTKIAQDIKSGKWVFDGTPIRFNGGGNILDGQHRLYAIIRANTPVESLVVRGLETCSKNTIDTGKARSVGDVLHFNGHINTTSLAAGARLVIGYRAFDGDLSAWNRSRACSSISAQEILVEAETNQLLVKATQSIVSLKYTKKLVGAGTPIFCYYLFASVSSQHIADSFFQSLEQGNDLVANSPILLLRNTLALRDSKSGLNGRSSSVHGAALFIKAWNAWRKKESLRSLSYRFDEQFPKPL